GRDPNRIKSHAKNCNKLAVNFPTLHKSVTKALVEHAHSTKLENVSTRLSQSKRSATSEGTTEGASEEISSTATPGILTYMNPAKISEQQKIKIELLMFRMFICCALPWALMDSQFFTDFILALAPNFIVPDRSAFFPKHLAQEVAVWGEKFKLFLEGKSHLTMSLDGWSTRAKDEIYTVHTTTPKRRSFFTDGHVFKGISVTGDALKDVLIRV
ncbi:hypothetical protein BYT27DRAFT_7037518, partial [Phlegmacium glaucopus]